MTESIEYEFDTCCPNNTGKRIGKCIVRHDKNHNHEIVLVVGDAEHSILQADRDQWGTWITVGDIITVAQEDGTRSFIDSLIKCLTALRECSEFETLESTRIP